MVSMNKIAAGGIIAVIAAYVYLSQVGGIEGTLDPSRAGSYATSPGGYVAGDIPVTGGGTTYVFPAETPPAFPAVGAGFDWNALFGAAGVFDSPIDPEEVVTAKKTAATTGNGSFGPGAGFGGGGAAGKTDYLPYQESGPVGAGAMPIPTASQGGGLLDTLSSYLSSFGRVVTRANPINAASQVGVSMGATVADLFTGGNAPNGGVGGRSGDEAMGSMTETKKVSNLSGINAFGAGKSSFTGAGNGAGAGAGGGIVSTEGIMSEEVSAFLHHGAGGAAKKTGYTSSGGAVYTHESGARSIVSGGQIIGGTSRALDSHDISRLSSQQRTALGYD